MSLWRPRPDVGTPRGLPRFAGVYVSHEDVFGYASTRDELVAVSARLPLRQSLTMVAALGGQLWRADDLAKVQLTSSRDLRPGRVAAEVARRLQQTTPPSVWITLHQVLLAVRYLCAHAQEPGDLALDQEAGFATFCQWLFMLSDEIARADEAVKGTAWTDDEWLSFFTVNARMHHQAPVFESVAESCYLWRKLLPAYQPTGDLSSVEVQETATELLGMPWVDFITVAHGVATKFLGDPSDGDAFRSPVISAGSWFRDAALAPEKRDHVLASLAATPGELTSAWNEQATVAGSGPYSALPLLSRPLVRIAAGEFLCPWPQFLMERITSGLHYTLSDHYRGEYGCPTNPFTDYWGHLLQTYVQQLFESVFPQSAILARRTWYGEQLRYQLGESEAEASDVVLWTDSTLALFEVTCSDPTVRALQASDAGQIKQDLDKVVVEKARQLQRVIRDFRDGALTIPGLSPAEIKHYAPVIVTWRELPLSPAAWGYIWGELSARCLLSYPTQGIERNALMRNYKANPRPCDPSIAPLQVLDSADLCMALAAAEHGEDLCRLLADRAASPEADFGSLANYLVGAGRKLPARHLMILTQEFEELKALLADGLFPPEQSPEC